MAEEIDSSPTEPEAPKASLTRRSRARREPARRTTAVAPARPAQARTKAAKRKPLRSLATLAIVAGLVATVAIPAYGALRNAPEAKTIQQAAQDGAQSLIIASDVTADAPAELGRDSYAATTPKEIAKKKAAEAAAARAKMYGSAASVNIDLSLVGPGTGAFRWPLAKLTRIGDGFLARGGEHQGVDLISPCKTPIFASADGVVRVSSESYFGYGVAITIDSVLDGKKVNTLYSHMTSGTRVVSVGAHVKAGQVIGLVGATGRAFGCHLHYEVKVNGSRVDPLAFLKANAG